MRERGVPRRLVPGTVSSGFAVSYLPRITGPGEVLVRLFASLRDRPSFSAAPSSIQIARPTNGVLFIGIPHV